MIADKYLRESLEWQVFSTLSAEYPWTEELLAKHADRVIWPEIVENESIRWTKHMLERFQDRIPWTRLSGSPHAWTDFAPETVRYFAHRWDWKMLSGNRNLRIETVAEFPDRLDWAKVIDNPGLEDEFGVTFYLRYWEYIPQRELPFTLLWSAMAREEEEKMTWTLDIENNSL